VSYSASTGWMGVAFLLPVSVVRHCVVVHELAPAHPRGHSGDRTHSGGEDEHVDDAALERPGDERREELLCSPACSPARPGASSGPWAQANCWSGLLAQEGGEEIARRREVRQLGCQRGRHLVGAEAIEHRARHRAARPAIMSEKKTPMESG